MYTYIYPGGGGGGTPLYGLTGIATFFIPTPMELANEAHGMDPLGFFWPVLQASVPDHG